MATRPVHPSVPRRVRRPIRRLARPRLGQGAPATPQVADQSAPPRARHAAGSRPVRPSLPRRPRRGGHLVRPSLSRWAGSAGHAGGGRPVRPSLARRAGNVGQIADGGPSVLKRVAREVEERGVRRRGKFVILWCFPIKYDKIIGIVSLSKDGRFFSVPEQR